MASAGRADRSNTARPMGSTLQTVTRGKILELVDRAIQVGYMAALKDVQRGIFDDDILQ